MVVRIVFALFLLMIVIGPEARSPAVEPVSGISIDHVKAPKKPESPKNFYRFDENKERKPSSKKSTSPAGTYREISSNDQQGSDFPYSLLLVPLLALPFIVRFVLNEKNTSGAAHQGGLTLIQGEGNQTHDDDDHDDFRQAS